MDATNDGDVSRARFEHGKAVPVPSLRDRDATREALADRPGPLVHRGIVAFPNEVAVDKIADAIKSGSDADLAKAIYAYALLRPDVTYVDLSNYFYNNGLGCSLRVVQQHDLKLSDQQTLMDLQGHIGKMYAVEFDFLASEIGPEERLKLREAARVELLREAGQVVWLSELPVSTAANAPPTELPRDSDSASSRDDDDESTTEFDLVVADQRTPKQPRPGRQRVGPWQCDLGSHRPQSCNEPSNKGIRRRRARH